ncbi:MAG: hypothetical protein HZA92_08710 [Verrucomicrobia bacterium]|nr:hypothetical protein [Verrucomicrobiota bacterium]
MQPEQTPGSSAAASLTQWLDRLMTALEARLTNWAAGRWWRLKLAAFCSLCSILYATPNLTTLTSMDTPPLWDVVHQQATHPLTPVPGLAPTSHESKRVFRLTMPLLAKLSPVGTPRGRMLFLFALQYAAGVLFFVLCFELFRELVQNPATAAVLTLGTAFLYPGQACFHDLFGVFDGTAVVFLLVAMWCRVPGVVFACLLGAFWIDERAVIAASFPFLWIKLREGLADGWRQLLLPDRASIVVPLAVAMTLGLRLWLTKVHGFHLPLGPESDVSATKFFQSARLDRLPIGLLSPFKLHWLVVGLAAAWLWATRRWALLVLGGAAVVASTAAALAVVDITRSLAYAFPAVIISVGLLARAAGQRFVFGLAIVLLASALIVPSYDVKTGAAWMVPSVVKLMVSPLLWR